MKALEYVFPGRFCPPTFGHFNVVTRAAAILPQVTVICSTNPDKHNDIFRPEESKELWRAYNLPKNVSVVTFEEFLAEQSPEREVVIIRGIRNYQDLRDEERVMSLNKELYGIDKYFYLVGDDGLKQISASMARELAKDLKFEELAGCIAPLIVSRLLERTLNLNHLFMVVGRPGGGKSTFLKLLSGISDRNVHLNTDEFNKQVRPLLIEAFGNQDLIRLSIERKAEFSAVIKTAWLDRLRQSLAKAKEGSNLFIEIPYGLQPDKAMYNYVGGKVIYVGCTNPADNYERLLERGTAKQVAFVAEIPDWQQTLEIGSDNRLQLTRVLTDGSVLDLEKTAEKFNQDLEINKTAFSTYSLGLY
jgi:pantetheine-phosphate adenylyltransferase